ncbi:MAG: sodium:panthothenate symporter [Phycisphaeraceae bacterium]|nr:sodium:panthothenate symporter [Phycisphaeraceae bacterium]
MPLIDWLIALLPWIVVFWIAYKAQKYVKGVSDFLTAGRVAGRYVLCVSGGEAGMGLISLVAMFEAYYQAGFAYGFWNQITIPIMMVMGLTGYCVYRFRETRAMTLGQFLEIRYSRSFRIFAAILQSISGVVNYAIFPAVGARFLVYYCDLPLHVDVLGMNFSTYGLVMAIFLAVAVILVTMGGQLTIMVTDCILGLLSYPLYAVIVVYLLMRFSWSSQMAPALLDRPVGESLLNPFDITQLRDFNLFYVFVGVISSILGRMSWSGTQGYNAAAKNAHEAKIGNVLATWRNGFAGMMYVLLAVVAFTFLNHADFKSAATNCRAELAMKTADDVAPSAEFDGIRGELKDYYATGVISDGLRSRIPSVDDANLDKEPMRVITRQALASQSKATGQTFDTIFGPMRVPMALRHILPIGITGIFCAICIFLMTSTDTAYMHSWGSIIVQDIMLPLRGRPFTPKQQLFWLRVLIACVALFAFLFSFYFAQVDFILMFFTITGAIWLGGAGPCIVGGLYWKRGTTVGAFASLIAGSALATGGMVAQSTWVPSIYPWLVKSGWLPTVTRILEGISHPIEPFIKWRVTPDKFPINSVEVYFITMVVGVGLYVGLSLLSRSEVFNLDRMLHRGKYARKGETSFVHEKLTIRNAFRKLIGITPEYTHGDKILAWSVFIWTFGWGFGTFALLVAWNAIYPWPNLWWAHWFKLSNLVIPCIIAVVSTVWFSIGGSVDLYRLFRDLATKEVNVLDDGRVIGHVSADEVARVDQIEHTNKPNSNQPKRD